MSTAEPKIYTTFDDYYDYNGYFENDSIFVYLCENHGPNEFGAILTPVLFSLAFIFSLIGNALVLWVLVRYERLRTVTDIFILNLVTSDVLFAFSLPFWAVDHTNGWIFGKAMCKIMSSIFFIGYYSGIMLLMLMTIDRYFTVVHPVSAVRIRKVSYAVTVSLVVWGISMLVTIPEMIFSDITGNEEERLYCTSNYPPKSTQMWQLLGCYQQNIFFVVIVFCYWRILNTVIRCKARKKHKTVKVIFCIVVVFFVCWTPYNVVIFLFSLVELEVPVFKICEIKNRLTYAFYISRDLAYCHCCLNPFFYAFVGTKFRNHLIRLLNKCFPHLKICRELSTTTGTSTKQVNSRNYSDIDLPLASIGS
ncbi:C-C chemokine receptor type 4-like [Rhincodon typus]|uniref:C-C chemokine receptor type 4-like n=1 Tax=Rhincodon typus TaxID=259920 RepID=UPI00202DCEE6|nr:C-C chemokine receptor type 4-like [Rhincodon typus]